MGQTVEERNKIEKRKIRKRTNQLAEDRLYGDRYARMDKENTRRKRVKKATDFANKMRNSLKIVPDNSAKAAKLKQKDIPQRYEDQFKKRK